MQGRFALHLKEWGRQVNILSSIYYYIPNYGIRNHHQDISPALPAGEAGTESTGDTSRTRHSLFCIWCVEPRSKWHKRRKVEYLVGRLKTKIPVRYKYAAQSMLSTRSISQKRETNLVTTGKWFSLCHTSGTSKTLKGKKTMWIIRNNTLALSGKILPKSSPHQRNKLVQTQDFFFFNARIDT